MDLDKILNEQSEKLINELEIDQNNIVGVIPVGFTATNKIIDIERKVNKIIKTFDDLEFEELIEGCLICARLKFNNGFGISVIKNQYSTQKGIYGISVLDDYNEINYKTPIADGYINHITPEEVTQYMARIQRLQIKYLPYYYEPE